MRRKLFSNELISDDIPLGMYSAMFRDPDAPPAPRSDASADERKAYEEDKRKRCLSTIHALMRGDADAEFAFDLGAYKKWGSYDEWSEAWGADGTGSVSISIDSLSCGDCHGDVPCSFFYSIEKIDITETPAAAPGAYISRNPATLLPWTAEQKVSRKTAWREEREAREKQAKIDAKQALAAAKAMQATLAAAQAKAEAAFAEAEHARFVAAAAAAAAAAEEEEEEKRSARVSQQPTECAIA